VWGTIGTDHYTGYHWIDPRQRQLCWAHLKREFVAWSQRTGETARIGLALLAVKKQLFTSWYRVRDGTLTWADFQVAMLVLMARVHTLLEEGAARADAKGQGPCRNLLKREAALWTFVWDPGVEPTNNSAERPLRRAVLWRRRSFGTQSAAGSQFVERILTAVTTLRQQRRDVLDYLTAACAAAICQQPAPSLLPLTPPPLFAGRVADFRERKQHQTKLTPEERVQKQLNTNFRIMEQIRARVDTIVKDPKTAAALKPYYPYGCKRPTFHDEYLPAFNLPHVHLVDTAPLGVREINVNGVVHDGVEYPLDVLIYATGFQWMASGVFNTTVGRDGRTITETWDAEGTKTFLGIHAKGFPNLFIVTGPQGGGGSFNFTDAIDAHGDYVVWLLSTLRDQGKDIIDVHRQPQEEYAEHCRQADIMSAPLRDCLSYYNGHGDAEPGSLAYYGGGRWHRYRIAAQDTLEPYLFGPATSD
jgi:hypothetical protein